MPDEPGGVGARSLNVELQKALNPAGAAVRAVRLDLWHRRQGDADRERLRQGGYNGDIGTIDMSTPSGELIVTFDGRSVTYGFGELDTLVPATPRPIHKSQGSEYPAVIIPV